MRICFYGDASDYRVLQTVRYFTDRGYETLLISGPGDAGTDESTSELIGIKVRQVIDSTRIPVLAHFLRLKQIKQFIKEFQPDYFHVDTVWPRGIYGAFSGFHPLVLSAWGSDISLNPEKSVFRRALVKHALKAADAVRVHDTVARDRVMLLGCKPEKVLIHVRGTDTKLFSPGARSEELCDKLGLTGHTAVISIRKLTEYYDVETLVRAIPLVVREEKAVRFVICGDGKQRDYLEKLTRDLGVTDFVTFTGAVAHDLMPAYLASCDIFVETYHTKKGGGGMGVGLIEAMSSGLAPIAAERPGIEFAVKEGYNGLRFKGGDPTDLAQKIIKLVRDAEKRRLFSSRSRVYMLEVADFERNMAKLEQELHQKLFGDSFRTF